MKCIDKREENEEKGKKKEILGAAGKRPPTFSSHSFILFSSRLTFRPFTSRSHENGDLTPRATTSCECSRRMAWTKKGKTVDWEKKEKKVFRFIFVVLLFDLFAYWMNEAPPPPSPNGKMLSSRYWTIQQKRTSAEQPSNQMNRTRVAECSGPACETLIRAEWHAELLLSFLLKTKITLTRIITQRMNWKRNGYDKCETIVALKADSARKNAVFLRKSREMREPGLRAIRIKADAVLWEYLAQFQEAQSPWTSIRKKWR